MILHKLLSSKNNLHNHKNADTKNSKAQSFFKKLKAPFVVFLAILTIGTVYLGFTTNQAKADGEAISKESILKKILINDLKFCYENNDIMRGGDESPINMLTGGEFNETDISPLFTATYDSPNNFIKLPNQGFISNDFSGKISCMELFTGHESPKIKGLYEQFRSTNPVFNISDLANDNGPSLGYSKITNNNNIVCFAIEFGNITVDHSTKEKIYTAPFCYTPNPLNQEQYIYTRGVDLIETSDRVNISCTIDVENNCYFEIDYTPSGLSIKSPKQDDAFNFNLAPDIITLENQSDISSTIKNEVSKNLQESWDVIVKEGAEYYTTQFCGLEEDGSCSTTKTNATLVGPGSPKLAYQYIKGENSNTAYKFFAGTENYDFTDEDRLFVLEYYIEKTMDNNPGKVYVISSNQVCKNYISEWDSNQYYLKIIDGEYSGKWCPIVIQDDIKNSHDYYHVIKNSIGTREEWLMQAYFYSTDSNNTSVLSRYADLVKSGVVPKGHSIAGNNSWSTDQQENTTGDSTPDKCYNANNLGWIICPIINGVSNAMNWLYDRVLEPFLIVNPSFFEGEGNVENAWRVVTNIANVIMIVFLLVIIFSQLTGVGIDNYGIKKALPKLIIAAILINLSFVICKLFVDLSNILGKSLNDWLSTLNVSDITLESGEIITNTTDSATWFKTAFNSVALGAGVFGTIGIIAGIAEDGVFSVLILPILLLLITALFAVLFMFLLLGLRQSGIILLVIAAPLAIVSYALPNTKKYFDKWLKALQGLLLLYPICGVLIGGGTFISKLLVSTSTNYMMLFVGCILMVIPFFLIPSLLKGSFKAMGNIGATVSGYGRRMRGWSTKKVDSGIRNSERFKQNVNYNKKRHEANRATRSINRLERRISRGRPLTQKQQSRYREAQDVMTAWNEKEIENYRRTKGDYMSAITAKQIQDADSKHESLMNYTDLNYINAQKQKQKLERENEAETTRKYNDPAYLQAQRVKQKLERENEAETTRRYNDSTYVDAQRESLREKTRLQQNEARTVLLTQKYKGEGLEQLIQEWNTAFNNGQSDDLSSITSIITKRYGSQGVNEIANSLNTKQNISNNVNYQRSLAALQQTLNDDKNFSHTLGEKTPDAFQMISDAGKAYNQASSTMEYHDMNWFTQHNELSTAMKDWAKVSGKTLTRSLSATKEDGSYVIDNDMIEKLLNSDAPEIVAGLQSEAGKVNALKAALYNRTHTDIGPPIPPKMAAARYNKEREHISSQTADEENAIRAGKQIIIPHKNSRKPIEGYLPPSGFNYVKTSLPKEINGHYIYEEKDSSGNPTGRKWDATIGRYVK